MAVPIDEVARWWLREGVGHVLLAVRSCDCCPRYTSLCGLEGSDGEGTAAVPAAVCPECRARLESPTLRVPESPYVGYVMRRVLEVEVPPEVSEWLDSVLRRATDE